MIVLIILATTIVVVGFGAWLFATVIGHMS